LTDLLRDRRAVVGATMNAGVCVVADGTNADTLWEAISSSVIVDAAKSDKLVLVIPTMVS